MRELTWMVDGRGEFEWSMTAHQMALQINMNLKKGTKAINPDVFNPFVREKSPKVMLSVRDSMDVLKKMFCEDIK